MGIGVEWKKLLTQDPALITVLPTDTEWVDDKSKPRFGVVLCDQTASVQQMNFAGCGQVISSGSEFERRIISKFVKDNLKYGAQHVVLLWDKPWPSVRRAEMYAQKRYTVPSSEKPVPPGKVRGVDGRFYHPAQAPLPKYDDTTGHGVKPVELITASKMYPLPQLLNAAWTKTEVAGFICKCLWTFAQGRDEHIVFDTPFLVGDALCDGQMKCNKDNCEICPDAKIPRHAEADVLYLFHIRHLATFVPPTACFMARGSNDRDLLVVLSFPFDEGLSDRVWWCKGSGGYAMSPAGQWVVPGKNTGKPVTCNEYVLMKRVTTMFGGANKELLLSRLMTIFFFGGDYCETPKGLTSTGLALAFFNCKHPIIQHSGPNTLQVATSALHNFVQYARDGSQRCRTQLDVANLMKNTQDAFYSLVYYTGFHSEFDPKETASCVGPDLTQFGYGETGHVIDPLLAKLFAPMLRPALSYSVSENFLSFTYT
jgi:hypothetical protein